MFNLGLIRFLISMKYFKVTNVFKCAPKSCILVFNKIGILKIQNLTVFNY